MTPKHTQVLRKMTKLVEKHEPGTRLPTIRALMKQYHVSQATIERCLDELIRGGLARREHGRGVFAAGARPRSNVLGVYTDGQGSLLANDLFLEGVRAGAEANGFHTADFGPKGQFQSQREILAAMHEMGFAGVIAALTTSSFMNIEEDRGLADLLRELELPLVTTRPLPAIEADSVMPDYYRTFESLGEHLRERSNGPVLFLGHQGLPSLARACGLRNGLRDEVPLHSEALDGTRGGAYERLAEVKQTGWDGSVVLGVPPQEPGVVHALAGVAWRAGSGRELVVVLEAGQAVSDGVEARVIEKPTRRLGELATELLIRRVRGEKGPMRHELVPHRVYESGGNEN